MKCRCPACGRTTQIPSDLLHFFTRCDRCAKLLKPFIHKDLEDPSRSGLAAKIVPIGRIFEFENCPRIALADLLSRHFETPQMDPIPAPISEKHPVIDRHKAIRQAELRGKHRILGTLSLVGLLVLGILTIAALLLKSHLFSPHSVSASSSLTPVKSSN